jgi:glyoxylase-like metal-dependent hydrolase (beta-lactamase superfamily II)
MSRSRSFTLIAAALVLGSAVAVAQRDFSKVEIKPTPLADGLWMLQGAGGNIGVCAGPDGVLLIDDQFAELSDKIKAAVTSLSSQPLRFVLNTHWHGDHVGGNENMANAGATIVAQNNVRLRMSVEQYNAVFDRRSPASPARALPVITFNDSLTFHLNGDDITCFHVAPAHTDGDVIVWFHKANVIHMGDCLFNGFYPVIDVSSGGHVAGMIAADDRVLAVAGPDTKLVPGHGPLATRADLQAFRDMLKTSSERIAKLVKQKKSLKEIQDAKPLADLDAKWGQGGIKPEIYIQEVVLDLTGK